MENLISYREKLEGSTINTSVSAESTRTERNRSNSAPSGAPRVLDSDGAPEKYAGDSVSPSRIWVPKADASRLQSADVSVFGHMLARSSAMQATLELAARYAPVDVSVLLIGETGTGKDVLAHEIHAQSVRSRANFVVFDCGTVAPNLAESELLGHERGAFTGAVTSHAGAFERACGGTLFLDEVGELPLDLQPKLLRALENRKGRRVGGAEDRPFDVRIIAATNRDLRTEVAEGRFRRDLYFRLRAALIPVPPLRERLEDLPGLAMALLNEFERPDLSISDEALTMLRFRSWPGNVRELKNALACAIAFIEQCEHKIEARHLGVVFDADTVDSRELEQLPLGGQRLDRIERAAILQTLSLARGNKVRTAQVLGIAVSTLYEKLKKYGYSEE